MRAYKLGLEEVNLIPSKYLMNLQPDVAKVYAYSYILRHHHDHHIGIDPLSLKGDKMALLLISQRGLTLLVLSLGSVIER